ncbi:MAG: metallophosphoesterase family protein [Bacteroidota bacterium]|nr:metallophosphoesterase family protein [Bacteroidota bacterium]
MKIAIISDIHGNLEALNAVLAKIDDLNIQSIYCLGDIVGYGPSPNECVELIRSRNIPSIAGNHDKAVTGELSIESFSQMAKAGVLWTKSIITEENEEYLLNLPYSIQEHDIVFVHSSPDHPEEFRYLLSPEDARESFDYFSNPLCVVGHTHRPVVFCEDYTTKEIRRDKKFIVNVGSVGQPRDGNWKACFIIMDTEQYTIEFIRVEYDVETVHKKIKAIGLPQKLADRLLAGM